MSTPRHALLALVVASIPATHAAAQAAMQPSANVASVGRLAWLAGCWQQAAGTRVVDEQWMAPRAGVMLGIGRTVRDDRVVEYEQVRIFERDGWAIYAAMPSGQPPAEFTASSTSDTLVTFENPTHDFPQRVIYRRRGADSLVARVEGTRGGQQRGVDFAYARTPCR
jgi:hypothetical protein